MRFFLVDKVTELVPGERARGVKNITLTDEAAHDHFPDHPIFPGTLIVEALAQLGGFLIEASGTAPLERALLAQIDRAKFVAPAWAGDQLELLVTLEQRLDSAAQIAAEARVGAREVARARLTFLLKRIESERVHEQRRWLYALWTRDLTATQRSDP
jgi:3-hydroxyacyl-[acyl-carrier-protein] dehydratase